MGGWEAFDDDDDDDSSIAKVRGADLSPFTSLTDDLCLFISVIIHGLEPSDCIYVSFHHPAPLLSPRSRRRRHTARLPLQTMGSLLLRRNPTTRFFWFGGYSS